MITIKTNHGDIVVELFEDSAPLSCENFRQYITDDFFTNTVFHRVIPNFMIQGGGMEADLSRKQTHDPIKNEADNGEKNVRGTLAMARTSEVDSATSQFFINLSDNVILDHGGRDFGYAVFGRVSSGMEVIESIAAVATGNRGEQQDVPVAIAQVLQKKGVEPILGINSVRPLLHHLHWAATNKQIIPIMVSAQ